jgi:hypothetical protein
MIDAYEGLLESIKAMMEQSNIELNESSVGKYFFFFNIHIFIVD